MRRTNSAFVIQVPYFDNISVNDIHTVPKGLTGEVETRLKVTPISYGKIGLSELARP